MYTQVYLDDMAHFADMNRGLCQVFPERSSCARKLSVLPNCPALLLRSMPSLYAILRRKKVVSVNGYSAVEPLSPGILTKDRLFISALRAKASDPEKEVELALDGFKSVVTAAGLQMQNVVFVNPYLTGSIPHQVMNRAYAKRFEFGNTPARATIEVTSFA